MNVFVAGATGAVGRALLPRLVQAGHQVTGTTRSPEKAHGIEALGARAVLVDALDPKAVLDAVEASKPDVIVEQLTSLPSKMDFRHMAHQLAATNTLRTTGTDHLIAAAEKTGVRRFVAQSFAGLTYARSGSFVKSEQDGLDPNPPSAFRAALDAVRHLESAVTGTRAFEGLALRYGFFYGPSEAGGLAAMLPDVQSRRVPIVGNGAGCWSFVHIDDVASATLAAVERGEPGIYNIVDDEPAPVAAWLPELARVIGAKSPFRVPVWLARTLIGEVGVAVMTQNRGASNSKAKHKLGWQPAWPTWRQGFHKQFAHTPEQPS